MRAFVKRRIYSESLRDCISRVYSDTPCGFDRFSRMSAAKAPEGPNIGCVRTIPLPTPNRTRTTLCARTARHNIPLAGGDTRMSHAVRG